MLELIGALLVVGIVFLVWFRITQWVAGEFSRARGIKALGWFLVLLFTLSFLFHSSSLSGGYGHDTGGEDGWEEEEDGGGMLDWWMQEEESSFAQDAWDGDSGGDLWDDDGD